jgi:hypothetical protein
MSHARAYGMKLPEHMAMHFLEISHINTLLDGDDCNQVESQLNGNYNEFTPSPLCRSPIFWQKP